MIHAARILLSLFLVAIALFCLYGFACTFEPLPPSTQWTWRAIYTAILIASLAGTWKVWRPKK